MLKKLIKDYYKFRHYKLIEAMQDQVRYDCLYGEDSLLRYQGLKLHVALEELKLEFFKGLPYVSKIIKTSKFPETF